MRFTPLNLSKNAFHTFEFAKKFKGCQKKCFRAEDPLRCPVIATPNVPANLKDPTLDGYGKKPMRRMKNTFKTAIKCLRHGCKRPVNT